jgi:hypothetical protein
MWGMDDKPKRTWTLIWAAIGLAAFAIGIVDKFVKPTNLTMSLVELFQFAVLIVAFIWFMNWPRHPKIWELQKKRRQELMELHGPVPNRDDPAVNPPAAPPEAPADSN